MKRIITSVLLLVFLNYLAGYYVIFWVLRNQADTRMTERLDADDYSDNETITFKFPFTLPYYNDSKDYERMEGEFQFHGEYYKLVKQKLERDTLYIVCIKDYNQKRITGMANDFVKQTNDMTANAGTMKIIGSFSKDYQPNYGGHFLRHPLEQVLKHIARHNFSELFAFLPVAIPPPKG